MLYEKLYNWQKQIIEDYKDREQFGIFLDMGLGKTLLSLAFAEYHNSDKILIVSINKKAVEEKEVKGSFFDWASQMKIQYNLYNKKNNFRNEGTKKYRATITPDTKDILLINYESTFKRNNDSAFGFKTKNKSCELSDIIKDFIESCKGKTVTLIVDESHNIKTLNSLQTKALRKIQRDLSLNKNKLYTYLLTGTPFTQGFIDLYSQLKFLGWEENQNTFEELFCIKAQIGSLYSWQQPIVGYKNINQLYRVVHRFAITIKSDMVVKLPEQVFVYHKSKPTEEMNLFTLEQAKKEWIEEYVKKNKISLPYELDSAPRGGRINNPFYRNIAFPEMKWLAETAGTFWLRARQLSIGFQGNSEEYLWYNKDRLENLKKLLADNPDNYILFYNFDPEFFEIFDICCELGYNVDVCNGSMVSEFFYNKYVKQNEAERLTNTKNILLANFASGSAGSNWQAYNKCILFSVPLFGDYQQSLKRVHRMGQKDTVVYHIFCQENWLDLSMINALKNQKEYDKQLFESDLKKIQNLLSKEE